MFFPQQFTGNQQDLGAHAWPAAPPSPTKAVRQQIARWASGLLLLGWSALCLQSAEAQQAAAPTGPPATPAAPPNIVLIYADDLGWGDLGCYGQTRYATPQIDRLATEGAKLTNFYSCCPYCAPSRAGLQTGRYPYRAGIVTNPTPDAGINDVGMPAGELTLGEALRSAGYATCCIGKWHLGHRPEFHPLRHGYDEYLGILYSNDMRPVELWDGNRVVEYPVVQATLTRRYTERAVDFITRNQRQPFFLYLPHTMPHKPLAASEKFYKKSGVGLYADVLKELDDGIGQILECLERLHLAENTIVAFSSDNGPWFGGSTGQLRGMKAQGYEGGLRVPLLVRWPGVVPPGVVNHQPAIILDLFPTLLAAAGVALPRDLVLDGRDIRPMLTSATAPSPHEALFSVRNRQIITVRSGPWKLHLAGSGPRLVVGNDPNKPWVDPRAPDGVTLLAPYEQYQPDSPPGLITGDQFDKLGLFQLSDDPEEQHNVAAQHPDVVARLEALAKARQAELEESLARLKPAVKPPAK